MNPEPTVRGWNGSSGCRPSGICRRKKSSNSSNRFPCWLARLVEISTMAGALRSTRSAKFGNSAAAAGKDQATASENAIAVRKDMCTRLYS